MDRKVFFHCNPIVSVAKDEFEPFLKGFVLFCSFHGRLSNWPKKSFLKWDPFFKGALFRRDLV